MLGASLKTLKTLLLRTEHLVPTKDLSPRRVFNTASKVSASTVSLIETPCNLWETHNHDPPKKPAGEIRQIVYDDTYSQVPPFDYWSL
jgi:hypothetical protein